MLLFPYGISAWVGQLPVDERQHIDHSYDPRDDLSSEQLIERLGSIAVTPRLSDGFQSSWVAKTLSLVWEGGLPRISDPETPAQTDLVVVWASLQGDIPKGWSQRTTTSPALPPTLVGQGGVPGKGPVIGRTGFVVALGENATNTVKVAFHKTASGPVLNVTTTGELVSEARYVNVLVVDRAHFCRDQPVGIDPGGRTGSVQPWRRHVENHGLGPELDPGPG